MLDKFHARLACLRVLFVMTIAVGSIAAATRTTAGTLDEVRKRGVLNCGVSEGLEGFSAQDKAKVWHGFDVDFCRAVAAAVLGDPEKVSFVPLSTTTRFEALTSGKIDLLARNTTWTMSRDVVLGFEFVGISYYDGQGFMTRRDNGLSSALQLSQATICLLEGTTSETNAAHFFAAKKITVKIKTYKDRATLVKDYDANRCDAYSADRSGLASDRLRTSDPAAHMLLPEVISKEPLGPVVRQGDAQWADINRWVLFLLINAEETGWTRSTAANVMIATSDEINARLGLDKTWTVNVIKAVGNYGEVFDRNVGTGSRLELTRGVNALWTRGGILYAPPMR
jgi:general L-amino acid transport system substrate-binding protein